MARQSRPPVPVLLTRPAEASAAFAAALQGRFGDRIRPVLSPLMAPEFLMPMLREKPSAVIFTSATGVAAAVQLGLPPVPAWCVGAQTAQAARKAGFPATSADGDAEALVAMVLAAQAKGPILHLRGEDSRGNVAHRLAAAGLHADEVVVYRQVPQQLTAEARQLLQGTGPVVLPVFSPRSATLLRAALPPDTRAALRLVAISAAAAQGFPAPVTARQPDAQGMLDAIDSVLETPAPP